MQISEFLGVEREVVFQGIIFTCTRFITWYIHLGAKSLTRHHFAQPLCANFEQASVNRGFDDVHNNRFMFIN